MKQIFFLCLVMIAVAASPAAAADVSQGKCIQYDKQQKVIIIEEYNIQFSAQNPYGQSTGIQSRYDVSKALIGITPEPGDILRLAYDVNGQTKVALRVMNVSKQDLRKK
jgi:opacity protein-like surface antigen